MASDDGQVHTADVSQPMRERPGLTREQVLTAALKIIDESGVEALTMRRLGRALNRNSMAIYRHADDKDALPSPSSSSPASLTVVATVLSSSTARPHGGTCWHALT